MNLDETTRALAVLYTLWKSNDSPEQLEREILLWQWAFENDPLETVATGIRMWMRGGNAFMPKPAQIRTLIAKVALDLNPDEEWGKIRLLLARHSRGLLRATFRIDPETDAVIHIGPAQLHPLVERTVDVVGESFLRDTGEAEARKAFIFTLQSLIEHERDRIIYGNDPIVLPEHLARTNLPENAGEEQIRGSGDAHLPELGM